MTWIYFEDPPWNSLDEAPSNYKSEITDPGHPHRTSRTCTRCESPIRIRTSTALGKLDEESERLDPVPETHDEITGLRGRSRRPTDRRPERAGTPARRYPLLAALDRAAVGSAGSAVPWIHRPG
jgi:hypothetical protein